MSLTLTSPLRTIVGIVGFSLILVACDAIDGAVVSLQSGVHSIEEIQKILADTKSKLDAGAYRDQVEEIIGRVGQTAQLTGQAYVDFVTARVVEDLQRIQAARHHRPPPPRVPVLATVAQPEIDFMSQARTTAKIVGWNLDIAANQPATFRVSVIDSAGASRDVPPQYVAYQGQYQVTVDVSSSGVHLMRGDKKLVFIGYEKPFEIGIIHSDEGVQASSLLIETNQDVDEKDADIQAHFILAINNVLYADGKIGKGDKWTDDHPISIRIAAPAASHLPCAIDYVKTHALPFLRRIQILAHTVSTDGSWDDRCDYLLLDSRFADVPPITGQGHAKLTILAEEDGSGWAGHIRLLGVVNGELQERQLLSDSFMINRDGHRGAAEFDSINW